MRRHAQSRRAALVAALVLAFALSPGSPASAEPAPQRCADFPGRVVEGQAIDGDLLVGGSCTLVRTVVRGDLVADAFTSWFRVTSSTVKGDVIADGHGELIRSTVFGGIRFDGPAPVSNVDYRSLELTDVTVRRSIRGATSYLDANRVRIEGTVNVWDASQVDIASSTVGGQFSARSRGVRVWGSTFARGFDVRGIPTTDDLYRGLWMCSGQVAGDVLIDGVTRPVEITSTELGSCELPGHESDGSIGGTLTITGVTDWVRLHAITVRGDLVCTGNTSTLQHEEAIVLGSRVGQCA